MTYKVGESGNPQGRPKGSGYRQQLFNVLVGPHKEDLFKTALEMALSGHENMLRLFLERMLPPKPTDEAIGLDISGQDFTKIESLLSVGKTILEGVVNAKITPEQAKVLMAVVDSQSKQIETHEFIQRMEAIERALKLRR